MQKLSHSLETDSEKGTEGWPDEDRQKLLMYHPWHKFVNGLLVYFIQEKCPSGMQVHA